MQGAGQARTYLGAHGPRPCSPVSIQGLMQPAGVCLRSQDPELSTEGLQQREAA